MASIRCPRRPRLRLLQGAPIYAGPQQAETRDADGRAARHRLCDELRRDSADAAQARRVRRRDRGTFADTPNVLRVLIGEADATAPPHTRWSSIEAEIDDMNPQIFGVLMDRLLAAGALDVFYTSIQMKKNRPGTLLIDRRAARRARAADVDRLPRDDDDRRAVPRDDARMSRSGDGRRRDAASAPSASRWRGATARS